MKTKLTEELKEIAGQGVKWAKLELEYIKLTTAEKLVLLLGSFIIGGVMALMFLPLFLMLLLALADVFKLIMAPALAYLSVAGIVAVLIGLLYVFRKQLVINPISRFMTKIILDKDTENPS